MTNMMSSEVRDLSDAEIDAVAGGNPGYFAAGVVVGAGLVVGAAAAVAVGAVVCDKMKKDEEKEKEVKIAPGT
jgi:hypothetical protein